MPSKFFTFFILAFCETLCLGDINVVQNMREFSLGAGRNHHLQQICLVNSDV